MRLSLETKLEEMLIRELKLIQIVTREPFVVCKELDDILLKYECDIIHYDVLQGFDVPEEETESQRFADTIDKWLYEESFDNVALIIFPSRKIFEDERNVLAIQKMVFDKSDRIQSHPRFVIMVTDSDSLPLVLKESCATIDAPLMNEKECAETIQPMVGEDEQNSLSEYSKILLGLTEEQVITCVRNSKKNNRIDIDKLRQEKALQINQSGLLSIESPCAEGELGGFEGLKQWLREIPKIPKINEMLAPKGMLLVGVTGCGKSLAAKVSASILKLPLLRIDFGRLMNKYVGESERNLSIALKIVEASAPCILWMDEFEKAFGSGEESNGVSQRMLGSFLTWLQERNGNVFTVATVNNISKLPAELLRRGRFDKIYFVDLPESKERESIIKIHADKVGFSLQPDDIIKISKQMQGKDYCGADIEYILKESRRKYFYYRDKCIEKVPSDRDIIEQCIKNTTPVGSTMAVEIGAMRKEFRARGFDDVNASVDYLV